MIDGWIWEMKDSYLRQESSKTNKIQSLLISFCLGLSCQSTNSEKKKIGST